MKLNFKFILDKFGDYMIQLFMHGFIFLVMLCWGAGFGVWATTQPMSLEQFAVGFVGLYFAYILCFFLTNLVANFVHFAITGKDLEDD